MSNPHLPEELLDHIVDFLHLDTGRTLKNCSLVSKSWIPRARKHLFADVWFETEEYLELWKKRFPDPSTSPGHYANALTIDCPRAIAVADGEAGGWIRGFSRVAHLELDGRSGKHEDDESEILFVPLQGLSPFVKSLNIYGIALPSSHIFDLILSFPLLEDLTVTDHYADRGFGEPQTIVQPSNPPVFTGSLKLAMIGPGHIARRLLSLPPGGIRFRKFTSTWDDGEDTSLITALVERCSHTLESFDIACDPLSTSIWRLRPYR